MNELKTTGTPSAHPHTTPTAESAGGLVPSDFRPALWLRNPHLQTLWASKIRRRPGLRLLRERMELPDGDFVDLDWNTTGDGPLVVVFHGLEGGIRSGYASGIMAAMARLGWRAALMHFRGCSGAKNRLARSYHSGDTGDIEYVLAALRKRCAPARMAAIGYSLGGNALVKYLGERGAKAGLAAAVAVSVPFDLGNGADRLDRGFSRLYQWHLLRLMKRKMRDKFAGMPAPIALQTVARASSLRQFDEHATAPLHGFAGADDYYARCSSRNYLRGVTVPTLLLHARDDPFMTPAALPREEELSPAVRFEISECGGHVGFVAGATPWHTCYWLEERIPRFLAGFLDHR